VGAALLFVLFWALSFSVLCAQTSTFDDDNEGWAAEGDPVSNIAEWMPSGGMPGGHIRVTDASVGGTWFFVAPAKFLGNKCDAYNTVFSYDQYTNDTSNQQQYPSRPDIEIFGNTATLVFNNPINPGTNWTSYAVLLRETAGWRLNSLNGPIPTEAQFRAVLADITKIRIRGEYRPQEDLGGLDNVYLENNFEFDLDGDDSSGATAGAFRSDTLCEPYGPLADLDIVLNALLRVDSIVVRVITPQVGETLQAGQLPVGIGLSGASTPARLVLTNVGNVGAPVFAQAILALQYADLSDAPRRGERLIAIAVYSSCGEMGLRYAYLPIYPAADAGPDGDTTLCANATPLDLRALLKGQADPGGFWLPRPLGTANVFDPRRDLPGDYTYIIPPLGGCPGDTAVFAIAVEALPTLRPDTTLCFGDTLLLYTPDALLDWAWAGYGKRQVIPATADGAYLLSGRTANCLFLDSVAVDFFTCTPCAWYAPNAFAPDGGSPENQRWQVFVPCAWLRFHLQVFDRWGNLVFEAWDAESPWDGLSGGRPQPPGVYLWQFDLQGELFGQPRRYRAAGDVTLLR
jgi:gliding motility-associated-like protein